jgi:hypothetical protein
MNPPQDFGKSEIAKIVLIPNPGGVKRRVLTPFILETREGGFCMYSLTSYSN